MSKYNYDKSALKGLGVGAFLGEVKVREQHIAEADATPPQSIFNSNVLASKLHPHIQFVKVAKVIDHGSSKIFELVPDKDKGTKELAYFRAGQYISIVIKDGKKQTCRPYTLMRCPKDALGENSKYSILVKPVEGGFASNYMAENWKEGTEAIISGPLGNYYYTDLRDAKHVVALAGGSGITPFHSMAAAIDAGIEDFKLTILYGSKNSSDILLKDELDAFAKRNPEKIKIVHVLSDEEKKGFEHGFISADLVKKYADEGDYSVFVCGPPAMYQFIGGEIGKLGLPSRRFRMEVPGEIMDPSKLPGFKDSDKNASHHIKVHHRGEVSEFDLKETTTLLRGMEDQGIAVFSDCRSGKCGWCRARLISGDVYLSVDNRRAADEKFGWIHLCSTYAKSDVEVEVFPAD